LNLGQVLLSAVLRESWQKVCRTQYLQEKWNVGRMGAQVFCQGDAGKVSFEIPSLLWRLCRLENGHEMCECGGNLFESVIE